MSLLEAVSQVMLLTEKHSPPQLKALGQERWEAVLSLPRGTTVTRGGLGLAPASRWDESAVPRGPGALVGAGRGGPPAERFLPDILQLPSVPQEITSTCLRPRTLLPGDPTSGARWLPRFLVGLGSQRGCGEGPSCGREHVWGEERSQDAEGSRAGASAQPSPPWGELECLSPATTRALSTS